MLHFSGCLLARFTSLALLAFIGACAHSAGDEVSVASQSKACVILLHGLWRTDLSMKAIEWSLEEEGYRVVNIDYPSLQYPIEQLAEMAVQEGIDECRDLGLQQIDFVTHSLGGILVRQYDHYRVIPGLHRVVMLGPPNQGSELADYVESLELLRALTPQAVSQLGTGELSVPRRLGPVNFQLGIIAGTANYRAFLPGVPAGPGDGTVAVAETAVPGALDILELPVSHSFMMWNQAVIDQVLHFLEHGAFRR